jgi:hypothetical protein
MRLDPSCRASPPDAVRACLAFRPHAKRSPTVGELEFAANVEMARGNPRRGELLSWAAHEARGGVSP